VCDIVTLLQEAAERSAENGTAVYVEIDAETGGAWWVEAPTDFVRKVLEVRQGGR